MDTVAYVDDPSIGLIRLAWRDDWHRHQTYYQVSAPRVSGTVTAAAEVDIRADPFDPDSAKVCLGYGRASGARWESQIGLARRPDRLTVNTVELVGDNVVSAPRLRAGPIEARYVQPGDAPDRTRERAAAILTAVARHWITRDPHYLVFRLAAINRYARAHLAEHYRRAQQARERLAEARADLTDAHTTIRRTQLWQMTALPTVITDHATDTRPPTG